MPGALKPLGAGFRPLINAIAAAFGASIDDAAAARITAWLDLVAIWNAKVDLTAARSPAELADLMLADGFAIARHEGQGRAFADVGSGAGAPGMAVHLARPDLAVTLIEPMQKRVAFLRTVTGRLAAGSRRGALQVVRARGEEIAEQARTFDVAVARATLAPDAWLALGARLVGPEGGVWVLLAREAPPALPGWEIERDERYRWPLTSAERRAVRYRRAP